MFTIRWLGLKEWCPDLNPNLDNIISFEFGFVNHYENKMFTYVLCAQISIMGWHLWENDYFKVAETYGVLDQVDAKPKKSRTDQPPVLKPRKGKTEQPPQLPPRRWDSLSVCTNPVKLFTWLQFKKARCYLCNILGAKECINRFFGNN